MSPTAIIILNVVAFIGPLVLVLAILVTRIICGPIGGDDDGS
jgi:hypothetical protein